MNFSKNYTLLIVSMLSVVSLVGCSAANDTSVSSSSPTASAKASQTAQAEASASETASKPEQLPLAVVEESFWPSDDLDYWNYLVLIENSNETFAWLSESFVVEAFDADGVLLDSDSNYSSLLPASTLALTGRFRDVGSSTISELSVRTVETGVDTTSLGEIGNVTFSEVEWVNERSSAVVSGIATSTFEEDQDYVSVVIVVRDENGEVVDADYAIIERLPGGSKARFEESFYDLKITSTMTIETYLDL
tara:strand:+ start:1728 stop:2474 length:747 start_codon:yes stop_codon:yes gene_type:complete